MSKFIDKLKNKYSNLDEEQKTTTALVALTGIALGGLIAAGPTIEKNENDFEHQDREVFSKTYEKPGTDAIPAMCGKIACAITVHKGERFYLRLDPEGSGYKDPLKIEVGQNTYEHTDVGDSVKIASVEK